MHHYVIAGDWHAKYLHQRSFEALLAYGETLPRENRALIINGDFLESDFLMTRCPKYKPNLKAKNFESYFIPLAEKEFQIGNAILDKLQTVFDHIFFLSGNHDSPRYDLIKEETPIAYKHLFDVETQLKLKERGIPYYGYNDWLDIGSLSITHGMYHGSTCLKKHFEACEFRNVIFSHIHHAESKAFVSRGRTKKVWSLPAMCSLSPEYLRNRDNNWSNGFGSIHMFDTGDFTFYTHEIMNDKLCLPNGKLV
jgi:hypothetical protein